MKLVWFFTLNIFTSLFYRKEVFGKAEWDCKVSIHTTSFMASYSAMSLPSLQSEPASPASSVVPFSFDAHYWGRGEKSCFVLFCFQVDIFENQRSFMSPEIQCNIKHF